MKNIIMGLSIVVNLHALTYEELLEQALKNNSQLQLAKNQAQKVELQGQINTRIENPNLEIEVADFSTKRLLRQNHVGARVGVSQSLLLPWVESDKKQLTLANVALEEENYKLQRSLFIYKFNLKYLAYKEAKKQEALAKEALAISEDVLAIAQERFAQGSIAKHELMQAQIEKSQALSRLKTLTLNTLQAKNRLLLFSNVAEAMSLEAQHRFVEKRSDATHPLLNITEKKEAIARASMRVASHTIERVELFSEIEAEPDQDIFRVGISVPLPIFNTKSQEKQLAKLELQNQSLTLDAQKRAIALELSQLKKEILTQEALRAKDETLLMEQQALLAMYQEGYAIAKVNLLKLNSLKKSLLNTQERIVETSSLIEKNSIKINYLQGAYNE
jgi:cobalt-zinc-cadmium efflux system outer membrane protein